MLCDIVLASETAEFQDSAHFPTGLVPGDGMHIIYPLLLGPNRGRYFLLTGQIIAARQAHELGLVGEVLPKDRVLARAWELAEQLAQTTAAHASLCTGGVDHGPEAALARFAWLWFGTGRIGVVRHRN